MKRVALSLLLASTAVRGGAAGGDPDAAGRTGLRREMLAEYSFSPSPPGSPAARAPAPDAPPPPDVVRMAPFSVRGAARMGELHSAIVQSQADARETAVADKLGIGVASLPIGRHFALSAFTVFYIPIRLEGCFSW